MLLSVGTVPPIPYRLRPQISPLTLSDRTKASAAPQPEPAGGARRAAGRGMDWLRPRLPALTDEVIAAVQEAVPEYRVVDRNVREGVRQALTGFTELAEGSEPAGIPAREVYV